MQPRPAIPTTDDIDQAVAREVAKLVPQVEATVARIQAETAAITQRIAEIEFEKTLMAIALDAGVHPGTAVASFVVDGREQFEQRDGLIVKRDGTHDPNDPCIALTFARWLETQRRGELWFLFRRH